MHEGLMFYDNSQTDLPAKVRRALEYFERKMGRVPNLVLVHPSMLEGQTLPEGMTVRPYRPVPPGNIWVGVEDEPKVEEPA